jgi:hypothetical protein
MNEQESTIQKPWSRPDSDRFLRSPLATDGRELIVSELYLKDHVVQHMLNTAGSHDVLYGLLAVLYFVFDPEAPMYKHLEKPARIDRVIESHVERSARKKVLKLIESEEFNDFRSDYVRLIATPAQQMLKTFTDEVHDFIGETNRGKGLKGEELRDRIKIGKQLLIDLEDLASFVTKEGKSKTRGGYMPTLFERRASASIST